MKKFLAVYTGTPNSSAGAAWEKLSPDQQKAQVQKGLNSWMKWGETYAKQILVNGGPLGKTKQVDKNGISDIKNALTGYVIVEAESHEAAAKLFLEHPHFSVFPGEAVEIMECLPLPTR